MLDLSVDDWTPGRKASLGGGVEINALPDLITGVVHGSLKREATSGDSDFDDVARIALGLFDVVGVDVLCTNSSKFRVPWRNEVRWNSR